MIGQEGSDKLTTRKVLTLIFSVMWSVIAGKGFSRHEYYLRPDQLSEAAKLGVTSRSICIGAIMMGKISVAFLIQRIQDPTRWRKWLLRFISISVFLSGLMAIILLFAQCQPAHALWTPSMIKDGTGHCWNPIPINNYDIVVGGALSHRIMRRFTLSYTHPKNSLLYVPRFLTCPFTRGHCMEASVTYQEKDLLVHAVRLRRLVGTSYDRFQSGFYLLSP